MALWSSPYLEGPQQSYIPKSSPFSPLQWQLAYLNSWNEHYCVNCKSRSVHHTGAEKRPWIYLTHNLIVLQTCTPSPLANHMAAIYMYSPEIHIHTNTQCMHTDTHTSMCTHTHTHAHTHTHTHTHACTHILTQACAHICTHNANRSSKQMLFIQHRNKNKLVYMSNTLLVQ